MLNIRKSKEPLYRLYIDGKRVLFLFKFPVPRHAHGMLGARRFEKFRIPFSSYFGLFGRDRRSSFSLQKEELN